MLEMVVGFPLWLTYKGRIVKENNTQNASLCMTGLFAIQGRVPKKISVKQVQILKSLKKVLKS